MRLRKVISLLLWGVAIGVGLVVLYQTTITRERTPVVKPAPAVAETSPKEPGYNTFVPVAPVTAPNDNLTPSITEEVKNVLYRSGGHFALVTFPLVGKGPEIRINRHEEFSAASTIKPFIVALALREALAGKLPLAKVEELSERAITVSDNEASNQLVEMLGMKRVNQGFRELNLANTSIGHLFNQPGRGKNLTSADDLGWFLWRMERGKVLDSPEISRKIYSWMLQQQRRGKIPRDLPPEAIIANKTGEIFSRILEHDIAIVEGPNFKFILVILIRDADSNKRAANAAAQVARLLWDEYVSQN